MAEHVIGKVFIDKDRSHRWDYAIRVESWEDGEYIITINGKPVGQSLPYKHARIISEWLTTAMGEIIQEDKNVG